MSKVKLDVIKPWITTKITQILGMEDDVVVEFVYNQLEEKVRDTLHLTEQNLIRNRFLVQLVCEKAIMSIIRSLGFFPSSYRKR